MSMQSEMMLALLGTLAQNEVESLSANVKMGIKMKMKRGEMMGFNGCLGYDYHKEDKSITVNHEEAETIRLIRFLNGELKTLARRSSIISRITMKDELTELYSSCGSDTYRIVKSKMAGEALSNALSP